MSSVALLAACSSRPAEVIDTAPDVAPCESTLAFTPVTVTGTSPGGSLDGFHFAYAGFLAGGATQLDPPDAVAPRIVGRFVSRDAAWSFDIAVDLTSQWSAGCI